MGIFDDVASKGSVGGLNLFSNSTPLGQLGNKVVNSGLSFAKSKIKTDRLPLLNASIGALNGGLLNGNWQGALDSGVNAFFDSGGLHKILGHKGNKLNHWLARNPLHANLTMSEVQNIAMQVHALNHVHKNLFLISISPYSSSMSTHYGKLLGNMASSAITSKIGGKIGEMTSGFVKRAVNGVLNNTPILNSVMETGGGMSSIYNLLVTDIQYTPFSIESEQWQVGSSIVDGAKSSQQAELTLTTYDDEAGTVKRFYKQLASAIIHRDGTVGVQSDGLVEIRILHGFVSDAVNQNGFEETIICRPVSTDYELSRKEDGLQEIQLRFIQTDTFI